MVDPVAKAICNAAGRSVYDAVDRPEEVYCVMCEKQPDGTLVCKMWTSFRTEAREAIIAAYQYHQKERRWPEFVRSKT